jgi:uncharacterized protein
MLPGDLAGKPDLSPDATSLGPVDRRRPAHGGGLDDLRGRKYRVLVTYKRSGEPVPTPVWFGLGDGKLYVRSEAGVAKVRRIRNDPRVRVAPCTVRGKPLGSPAMGHARVLDSTADEARAERALRANYGLGRRVYEGVGGPLGVDTVYLEIAPA